MLRQTLFDILTQTLAAHIVSSEREFCLAWLGMSASYLQDFRSKDRILADVSARTTSTLRERLAAVADFLTPELHAEMWDLIALIDESAATATALRR